MKRVFLYIFIYFIALNFTGCAYFNTFYYAKKYFNEGLKAIEREKNLAQSGTRASAPMVKSPSVNLPQRRTTAGSASFDKCIEKGSKLLESYPRSKWVDDCLYILGRSFYYKQDYTEASKKFEELCTVFPESKFIPEARLWWGKTFIEMKNFGNAEEQFQEAIDSDGSDDTKNEALLGLAEILYIQEKYEQAIVAYQDIVTKIKKKELKAEAQLKIGECYFQLENYNMAAENFYKARDFTQTQEQKYQSEFRYGIIKKTIGDFDEAVNIFQNLLSDGKNVDHFPELRIHTADCLNREGKLDEAISIYEDIGNIYSKTIFASEAYYNIGLIYYKNYLDFKKAYESFTKSISSAPRSEPSEKATRIARDIVEMNKIKDALANEAKEDIKKKGEETQSDTLLTLDKKAELERLKKIENRAKNRYLLGEIFLDKIESVDSALVYFNIISEKFPESTFAPKSLLQIYDIYVNKLNKSDEAKGFLEELVEKYPQSDLSNPAREKLGLPKIMLLKDSLKMEFLDAENLYFKKKKLDEAIEKYRKIYLDFPESEFAPKCLYLIGWHYENEELNVKKAIEEYKKLVEDYPESEFAKLVVLNVNQYEKMKEEEEKKKIEEMKKKEDLEKKEKEITIAPRMIKQVDPSLPDSVKKLGIKGTIDLSVEVDASGKVIDVVVQKSAFNDTNIVKTIVEAAYKCAFIPAEKESKKVKGRTSITYNIDFSNKSTPEKKETTPKELLQKEIDKKSEMIIKKKK